MTSSVMSLKRIGAEERHEFKEFYTANALTRRTFYISTRFAGIVFFAGRATIWHVDSHSYASSHHRAG